MKTLRSKIKPFLYSNKNFVLYTIFGAISVSSDFISYLILLYLTHTPWVNLISYLIGTAVSFTLNSKFNFKVKDKLLHRYGAFIGVALSGSLLSTLAIVALSRFTDPRIAKLLLMPFILVYQYSLSKRFVYSKKFKFIWNNKL